MKKVCVITGGGSGMGLATAGIMGKEYRIVIAGRTVAKLEGALRSLAAEGIKAEAFGCDVSNRAAVEELARRARKLGPVAAVVNCAGLSPAMGDALTLMKANALGAINVNDAFYRVMDSGSCIVQVSSMAGHILPRPLLPAGSYRYARSDRARFLSRMMSRVNLFPQAMRAKIAYGISKNFVIWYARAEAGRFGERGIRILSVSPGLFDTPMGEAEMELAGSYTEYCAIKRMGRTEEIGQLLAFCAGDKPGYLTGTDILCDGGCIASGVNFVKVSRNRGKPEGPLNRPVGA